MNSMKAKVYSTSDFQNAVSSIIINDCFWLIDSVRHTKVGEYSKAPLFELQLKQYVKPADAPEGFTDGSMLLTRNRTYYVREGRPLYNELVTMWKDLQEDFAEEFINMYEKTVFKGHVERVDGISYHKSTRWGTVVSSSRVEFWYPVEYETGTALEDFVYLCNKGVYTPVVEKEKKSAPDPIAEAISKLDPKIVEAILAMKK